MPSLSLSARERRNPPSRRKSCAACIKSKRRCDASVPCFRCQQRKIPCIYSPSRTPHTSSLETQCPSPGSHTSLDWSGDSSNDNAQFAPAVQDELLDLSLVNESINDDPFQSSLLMAPVSKELELTSEVFRTRLQYAVDIIKGAPMSMLFENQTPWCHPLLYKNGMPKFMQGELTLSHFASRNLIKKKEAH